MSKGYRTKIGKDSYVLWTVVFLYITEIIIVDAERSIILDGKKEIINIITFLLDYM